MTGQDEDSPPPAQAMRVGIAIVMAGGKVLVGRREPHQSFAGMSEFPGGKCEPGEQATDCAVRECLEETGLAVRADRILYHSPGGEPPSRLDLTFVACSLVADSAEPQQLPEPTGLFQWTTVDQLPRLRFPPANAEIVRLLVSDQQEPGRRCD